MAITNGRNLAELASLINSDGKISAEAFSAELAASIDPTLYDSASDVPFEDAVKGTQVFVPSEGLLIKLTDSDWYSIDGSTGAAASTATQAQGSVSGYTSGGEDEISGESLKYATIDKFPFASDGNATDVGDLTQNRRLAAGQSSAVSGYTSGGSSFFPGFLYFNTIDKFPFASDGNATYVGSLTATSTGSAGQSSTESGYTSGGYTPSYINVISKFSFTADGNATNVGVLTDSRFQVSGNSSSTSGYTTGGYTPGGVSNIIDKFPFASDGNATDVGDLTVAGRFSAGQNSDVSGYTSAGAPGSRSPVIDKFPFASDGNATDVGDLTQGSYRTAGQSSTESGYSSGGKWGATLTAIDKFPFASDGNATDVGDLTQARESVTGQQV